MSVSLDSAFPGLVRQLEAANPEGQLAVALAAAQTAIRRTQLREYRVDAAVSAKRIGESAEREDVRVLSDELDEVAWTIQARMHQGAAAEEEYTRAFRRARAASALFFALDENPLSAAIQALYEAHHAIGDAEALRQVVDRILARQSA